MYFPNEQTRLVELEENIQISKTPQRKHLTQQTISERISSERERLGNKLSNNNIKNNNINNNNINNDVNNNKMLLQKGRTDNAIVKNLSHKKKRRKKKKKF